MPLPELTVVAPPIIETTDDAVAAAPGVTANEVEEVTGAELISALMVAAVPARTPVSVEV